MYELIAEYLGNKFKKEPVNYIKDIPVNQTNPSWYLCNRYDNHNRIYPADSYDRVYSRPKVLPLTESRWH